MRSPGRAGSLSITALAALAAVGCNLSDRLRTCEHVPVDLVNDPQTRAVVNIAGPEEAFLPENRLDSGASRRIVLCLERGDRKKFRAEQNGVVVAVANCVASLSTYEA